MRWRMAGPVVVLMAALGSVAGSHAQPAAPAAPLDAWAARLSSLGIRSIDGRLVGDDDALPDQALGTGWAWDDLAFGYAAPIGALQYHESAVQVVIASGPR